MQPLTLINGSATRTLASSDRGLNFGQGVSTRIKVVGGQPQLWREHMQILQQGCAALGFHINAVDKLVKRDLGLLPKTDLRLRITLTAGLGSDSLATPTESQPTRIVQIDPWRHSEVPEGGIVARVCQVQLAKQPRLAGIKHLHRIEQVLARSEWRDSAIAEGVILDTDEMLVSGTRSNLFWVRDGNLYTPQLSYAGVKGAMRSAILRLAKQQGVRLTEVREPLASLWDAQELFFCNALEGILPVKALAQNQYAVGNDSLTTQLQTGLTQVLYD